ncbi:hypothetical protein [Muribaculum intestinale]|uniref:hypothetical protein n=1 Tax=Muribaculum intestinale TaxID=1796646 RepID=UPI00272D0401|nr:hypothetical protein [Muribaculum intestinale]
MAKETTKQLNAQLQIVRLDGLQFKAPLGTACTRGWGLYIDGKGYLKFKCDSSSFVPYAPIGGRKALESILEAGGLLNYNSIEFINPIKH